jgi:chemotaxis protein methyltransferase CheR
VGELHALGIGYKELDILGRFHRKILYDPATGTVTLYKKSDEELSAEAKKIFSSNGTHNFFRDPKKRLIVGASLFFRNELLLEHIQKTVLPGILKKDRRLHIWCAGCSIGMEAYSVAMIILYWLSSHRKTNVDFKILGTDISIEALEKASKGEYSVNEKVVQLYLRLFSKYTERIDIHNLLMGPQLKEVITFKQRDITTGSRRHRFDLVICDHVLQYFSPKIQLKMLHSLATAVRPGAFLYVSSPSSSIIAEELAEKLDFTCLASKFYQKD